MFREENKIEVITKRVDCRKHKASRYEPCFQIESDTGEVKHGVCNRRAVRAGFTGRVKRSSLIREQFKSKP